MRLDHLAAGAMIDRGLQILNQRAVAPDIQTLSTVADGQDRLVEVEGVLKQQLIHGGPGRVGLAALGNWIFAKSLWVNIVAAARQQDSLHPDKQLGDAILALVQGNDNRRSPGGFKRSKVGWQ